VADRAPKVKIIKPTKTTVLLPDETFNIHFKASDDHGIQKMALRVTVQREGEDQPMLHEVEIPIKPKSNNRKIKGSVELDLAQFNLKDGDAIRYEIRASDNFRPLKDSAEQTDLHPMKGVELAQAETAAAPNNAAASASPNNQDPNSTAAQGNPQATSANNNSAANPSNNNGAAAASNATAQTNSPQAKAAQSRENQIANASPEELPNNVPADNTAQPATPAQNNAAKDSKSSAVANSDPSMQQRGPANATPATASASSASASNASSSQANQSSQASGKSIQPSKPIESIPASKLVAEQFEFFIIVSTQTETGNQRNTAANACKD